MIDGGQVPGGRDLRGWFFVGATRERPGYFDPTSGSTEVFAAEYVLGGDL